MTQCAINGRLVEVERASGLPLYCMGDLKEVCDVGTPLNSLSTASKFAFPSPHFKITPWQESGDQRLL